MWNCLVEVKREIPLLPGEDAPILLAGESRCPPEDVESLSGFEEFLEAMADPKHPEHEAMTTWYGGSFGPADIDAERINTRLAAIPRRGQRGRTPSPVGCAPGVHAAGGNLSRPSQVQELPNGVTGDLLFNGVKARQHQPVANLKLSHRNPGCERARDGQLAADMMAMLDIAFYRKLNRLPSPVSRAEEAPIPQRRDLSCPECRFGGGPTRYTADRGWAGS